MRNAECGMRSEDRCQVARCQVPGVRERQEGRRQKAEGSRPEGVGRRPTPGIGKPNFSLDKESDVLYTCTSTKSRGLTAEGGWWSAEGNRCHVSGIGNACEECGVKTGVRENRRLRPVAERWMFRLRTPHFAFRNLAPAFIRHSAFCISYCVLFIPHPHSAFRIVGHLLLGIPHSAVRIPHCGAPRNLRNKAKLGQILQGK